MPSSRRVLRQPLGAWARRGAWRGNVARCQRGCSRGRPRRRELPRWLLGEQRNPGRAQRAGAARACQAGALRGTRLRLGPRSPAQCPPALGRERGRDTRRGPGRGRCPGGCSQRVRSPWPRTPSPARAPTPARGAARPERARAAGAARSDRPGCGAGRGSRGREGGGLQGWGDTEVDTEVPPKRVGSRRPWRGGERRCRAGPDAAGPDQHRGQRRARPPLPPSEPGNPAPAPQPGSTARPRPRNPAPAPQPGTDPTTDPPSRNPLPSPQAVPVPALPAALTVAVDQDDGQHVVLAQHGPAARPARRPRRRLPRPGAAAAAAGGAGPGRAGAGAAESRGGAGDRPHGAGEGRGWPGPCGLSRGRRWVLRREGDFGAGKVLECDRQQSQVSPLCSQVRSLSLHSL